MNHRRTANIGLWVILFHAVFLLTSAFQYALGQNDKRKNPDSETPQDRPPAPVATIVIKHVINPSTADFVVESVKRAEKENAQCLVIMLDTPGGLIESTREIVQSFFASNVPVIVFVAPSGARAGSAGVFITMASHVAAMAPGTNIGAAHPVGGSGEDIQGDMKQKVVNDAVAQVRSWAQERGRNVEWVEKAIRESSSITDKDALELKVVEISATDMTDLLKKLNGREVNMGRGKKITLHTESAQIIEYKMNLKQKIVSTISQPNVAYILLLIGMLGLFLEYVHPGTLVPGIVGGICIILFFVVQNLPINYVGVALILLAVIFFIAEIFISSFGLLTIGGIVSFVIGAILLFDTPTSTVTVSRSVIYPTVAVFAAAFLGAGLLVLKSQLKKPVSGKEGFIGKIGEAKTDIAPSGTVFLHGELWTAYSKTSIPQGAKVKVLAVKDMKLEVEKAEEEF